MNGIKKPSSQLLDEKKYSLVPLSRIVIFNECVFELGTFSKVSSISWGSVKGDQEII